MDFERSVFINCPFDRDYDKILQAILFCIVHLGFDPRISREVDNAGQARLDTIQTLIGASKYPIHDLYRCQAEEVDEIARLHMPFELGIVFCCKRFGNAEQNEKAFLILPAN